METNRRGLVNRKLIIAILVYIGLIAICCIALYAVPSLKGMLEKTYIAEHGTIDVNDEVSAFIVRDESVYVAAQDSYVNRIIEEGKLVKYGTKVAELTDIEEAFEEAAEKVEKQDLNARIEDDQTATDAEADKASDKDAKAEDAEKASGDESKDGGEKDADAAAQEDEDADAGKYTRIIEELGDTTVTTKDGAVKGSGYVSYFVDGAEAKLSTSALESLTYDDLKSLTKRRSIKTPDHRCGESYPVFKIVRNSKWYLVYYIDNEKAEKYVPGDTVTLNVGESTTDVKVYSVEPGGKKAKVVLTCKSFFDGFLEERTCDATVTVVSAEGLVVLDESIVDAPDGKRGVFIKNKLGEHEFVPVRVKADDGTQCVVYSDIYVDDEGNYVETLRDYDEIIEQPSEEDIDSLKPRKVKKDESKTEAKQDESKTEAKAEEKKDEVKTEEAEQEEAKSGSAAAEGE